jgi:hypothetical protein
MAQESWEPHNNSHEVERAIKLLYTPCCTSWLMVLLAFLLAGFILGYLDFNPVAVFAINFIAVFPVVMVN